MKFKPSIQPNNSNPQTIRSITMSIISITCNCCFVIVCIAAVGCPTNPGGDPAVWQETTLTGEAKITKFDAEAKTISFQFTHENETDHTETVSGLALSSVSDLPKDYSPGVGDILQLKLHTRYKRKAIGRATRFLAQQTGPAHYHLPETH